MGPGRNHGKNSAAFVLFFFFTLFVAGMSSCHRAQSMENAQPESVWNYSQ